MQLVFADTDVLYQRLIKPLATVDDLLKRRAIDYISEGEEWKHPEIDDVIMFGIHSPSFSLPEPLVMGRLTMHRYGKACQLSIDVVASNPGVFANLSSSLRRQFKDRWIGTNSRGIGYYVSEEGVPLVSVFAADGPRCGVRNITIGGAGAVPCSLDHPQMFNKSVRDLEYVANRYLAGVLHKAYRNRKIPENLKDLMIQIT